MTRQYTPGLKVAARTAHRARRVLPVPGEVLASVGQRVTAHDVVARAFLPGDVTPLNLAHMLSVSPADVPALMLKREGDTVQLEEPLARTKGIFGFFKSEGTAKVAGTIETISHVTGQVLIRNTPIPVQVDAWLAGTVVEVLPGSGVVIEAEASLVQGIFGIGGEAHGPLKPVCTAPGEPLTAERLDESCRGAIVVGGARVTAEALTKAVTLGVAAIVTGGIDDQDLRDFLGYDVGVAITGNEKVGLTLILTEGFGDIAMAERTFRLLSQRTGQPTAVNGATQIRAGVQRPEILIPWTATETPTDVVPPVKTSGLEVGAPVRIIRDPHFGLLGTVAQLPPEARVLESGSRARVLDVRLAGGQTVTVPRANVELIED